MVCFPAEGGNMSYNVKIDTPYITDKEVIKKLEETFTGKMEYTLVNDFLSKYGLQKDLYALKGLLAALLMIDINSITDIQILNPIEPSSVINAKDCVLDIKLEINNSRIINIEIQNRCQDFWPDRAVTYMCRLFDNLDEGQDYDQIKPCVHIGILNFSLKTGGNGGTDEFYSDFKIINTKSHDIFTEKFVIKQLILNNIENATKEQKEDNASVYYWAKLFKAKTWEEMRMIAEKNDRMKSLVNTACKLSDNKEIKEACHARSIYQLDINTYEHRIQKMDKIIDEKEDKIKEQRGILEEQRGRIEEQRGRIEEQREELEVQKEQLQQKDLLIEELRRQIEKMKTN